MHFRKSNSLFQSVASWMCNKQTTVSHSSTESEVISLDAGLRVDGIPSLDPWDLVTDVLHSSPVQCLYGVRTIPKSERS